MTDDTLAADFGRDALGSKTLTDHPGIDRSRWGLFTDFDVEDYHRGSFGSLKADEVSISQSQMRRILDETPLDFAFNHPQLNPDREKLAATVAQHRGDLVHQLALGKGRGYEISPHDEYRSGEAKAWRDRCLASGKVPVKQKEFEAAEVMADVIKTRIDEVLDGAPYETEVAFLYQEMTKAGPIWVRGMVDVWCPERLMILDPKVTPNIYDGLVERHIVNMGWDLQGALYPHAFGMILGLEVAGRIKFRDLMIKPVEPFTSRVVEIEKAWQWTAIKRCQEAMERFGRCLYAGRWPGFEGVHVAELPTWEAKKREAAELAGE